MLRDAGVEYDYREYTESPLSVEELQGVLAKLGVGAQDLLRRRDPAYRELSAADLESEAALLRAMAASPTLLQRPIAVRGERAVVGRPAERVLELVEG